MRLHKCKVCSLIHDQSYCPNCFSTMFSETVTADEEKLTKNFERYSVIRSKPDKTEDEENFIREFEEFFREEK